jgi:pimeloyl-ACP methyl ester carboxylesterase
MRKHVRQCVAEVGGPVILIGHSLGGVIGLEALSEAEMPAVRALITVGSQTPYLYELGALPVLHGPLPATVPERWTNVYDPRDLLSFVGEPIFPGRVLDEAVDGRCPFPRAHSAYFDNPRFYRIVAAVVAEVAA